jgi:hypothetical protein
MKYTLLLAALVASGCAPEPAWEEGPIGEIYEGLSVGGAGGCSTFILDGLSKQLIDEQNCIRPDALVSFAKQTGISVGSNVYPYLEPKAAAGLEAAGKSATLSVSSAFRTIAQQYLLYHWYQTGQCGIGLAAVPGNSNHETGIAVDLSNYSSVIGTMGNHGWTHSYPSSDPVHFDYTAGGTIDLRSESVLAFQKLWNLNNPGDKIAEDGSYGPMTASKIAAAPATGFAKGSTCAKSSTPSSPPPPGMTLTAQLTGQSMPQTLESGQVVEAYVEFKNTGNVTWTPALTHLGTLDPQDRDSALAAPDWLSQNRPTGVDKDTKPGEIGRFTFSVRGPAVSQATALTEHFGLVQEGVAWFPASASITFDLEVDPSTAPAPPETGDPTADPSGTPPATASGDMHGGCDLAAPGTPANAALPLLALALIALALLRRRA